MKPATNTKMLCKFCQKKRKLDKLRQCSQCKREHTKTYWKKKLWDAVRAFVHKRDSSTCFTCGKRNLEGSNRHCGHFITGATCPPSLYYNPSNLHTQCYHDNVNLSGNWVEYERRMIAEYGQEHVDWLKREQKVKQGEVWDIARFKQELKKYNL